MCLGLDPCLGVCVCIDMFCVVFFVCGIHGLCFPKYVRAFVFVIWLGECVGVWMCFVLYVSLVLLLCVFPSVRGGSRVSAYVCLCAIRYWCPRVQRVRFVLLFACWCSVIGLIVVRVCCVWVYGCVCCVCDCVCLRAFVVLVVCLCLLYTHV